ncbi:MAG: hypothetical protein ACI9G1_002033 [Pirellulaceae bacterium]
MHFSTPDVQAGGATNEWTKMDFDSSLNDDDPTELDYIAENAERWSREHFIPVRPADLVDIVGKEKDLDENERLAFQKLAELLEATVHHDFLDSLRHLKNEYDPFDPDSDTRAIESNDSEKCSDEFFDHFVKILEQANYRKLTREEIELAASVTSDWGINLSVDFELFERLEVFVRGDIVGHRSRRRLLNLYRLEEVQTQIYQRLAVVFRLRDHPRLDPEANTNAVYLKLFKNIPQMDIEMLLPGSRVKMTWLDQGKILVPTISGIAFTLFKLVKLLSVGLFLGLTNVLAFLGLVGGTLGYAVKSFFSYVSTRDKYRLNLTRSLYYQNLDNNAGVLFRVLNDAQEQELRELLLGYYVLWKHADDAGMSEGAIDKCAERLVKRWLEVDVDFEVGDAVQKLRALGLAECIGKRWRVVDAGEAKRRLDQRWDALYLYHQETLKIRKVP